MCLRVLLRLFSKSLLLARTLFEWPDDTFNDPAAIVLTALGVDELIIDVARVHPPWIKRKVISNGLGVRYGIGV